MFAQLDSGGSEGAAGPEVTVVIWKVEKVKEGADSSM